MSVTALLSEIATGELTQVREVLLVDRLVVAELVLDVGDDLGRRVAAERGRDRITRRNSHQQEDEGHEDEDHREDERHSRQCVTPE